jgi:hypothetical protein
MILKFLYENDTVNNLGLLGLFEVGRNLGIGDELKLAAEAIIRDGLAE